MGAEGTSVLRTAWTSLLRLRHLMAVVVRHAVGYYLGPRLPSWAWLRHRLPDPQLTKPERLRTLFEDLGGTFVKFGQMLALQPDILSLEYCNALFKLLDRVEPFPLDDVERIFRRETGRSTAEVFDRFTPEPLATASVGQVHVAWLHGQKVAVKVQRPNVDGEFGSDIRLMNALLRAISLLRLRFLSWMVEPTTEFVAWTAEELDYRFEARYTEQLRHYARDNAVQYVPKIYDELTTRRVLVSEFLEGTTLLAYLRARETGDDQVLVRQLEQPGFDSTAFAAHVIDNFLGDAFRNGIYHADLHPANLLILPDSVVGYIDFGITGVMSRHARRHLVSMTLALAVGDLDLLCQEFIEVAAFDPEADPRAFRDGLERLAADWYVDSPDERRLVVNFTRIMGDMLTLSRQSHVLPERDIVKYIRSAIAIDGLITRFEPSFDVGGYLAESCARYLVWQDRGERIKPGLLLDAAAAGGKLWSHGPRRLGRLLDQLSSGQLPVSSERSAPVPRGDAAGRRAVELAAAAVIVALLTTFFPEPAGWGWNLWSVQILFVILCLVLLSGTVYRLLTPPRVGVSD